MVNQQTQEKYAELALRTGVNLQKNQALMINAPIEGADFTKLVARKAYELGAKDVHINWVDDELTLLKYTYVKDDVLATYPDWRKQMQESHVKEKGAIISIHSTDPDLLKEIDPSKVALANKAAGEALTNYRKAVMNDEVTWTVISIPTT